MEPYCNIYIEVLQYPVHKQVILVTSEDFEQQRTTLDTPPKQHEY